VPGSGDHLERRVRQSGRETLAGSSISGVSLPGENRSRHRHCREPVPERFECPTAERAQCRGELSRRESALILGNRVSDPCRVAVEQRNRAPTGDEVLDGSVLDLGCECLVSGETRGLRGPVLDSGARGDQYEAGYAIPQRGCDVKSNASAHRITAQDEPLRRPACDEVHRPREGQGIRVGELDRERRVAFAVRERHDAVPVAPRTAEPVQQHDRLEHPTILTPALDTHLLIGAFVDELTRCGVTDACTSPGSRCAPLVLALARDPHLNAYSHIDERCSGFFALGLAKASGRPVAVTCTSGTAAANLMPAVVEADEARVPLIVLTADRPPELRDVGAGQTIDQIKLYGDSVRWFFEVGTHEATPERLAWIRALACRAVAEACGERPGPVHLNWPLREPLVPGGAIDVPEGRSDRGPWVLRERPSSPAVDLGSIVVGSKRGVIVAGRSDRPLGPALGDLAARCGYPLLAEPLSGARGGAAAIAHYDLLLRDREFAAAQTPEVVIRVGDLPTCKPLRGWLAGLAGVRQIAIDPEGAWQDPAAVVGLSLRADVDRLTGPAIAEPSWLAAWLDADRRVGESVAELLRDDFSELGVSRALGEWLPAAATLFVASSMPVREIEAVWAAREDAPRVLSNRGANGIDGTLSSAFGVAAHSTGPVCALIGDVAFAHDIGGLLAASRLDLALTVVLFDNGGGGIFDHLPIAGERDVFEEHIATPTGLDFEAAATLYGLEYVSPTSLVALRDALDGALASRDRSTLLHLRFERDAAVTMQRSLHAAAAVALS
jgi:2-succinyl-5-enolpyruvyl-6-hydroxy-3-cyclohexene-1-carboxylate synthase